MARAYPICRSNQALEGNSSMLKLRLAGVVLLSSILILNSIAAKSIADVSSFTVSSAEYPWSAIGRLNKTTGGFCTAVLVGRGKFIAHSLALDYWLSPGYNAARPAGTDTASADWALVLLRDPVGDKAGYLALSTFTGQGTATHKTSYMPFLEAGYRQSSAHILSVRPNCEIISHSSINSLLIHSCISTHGESGSPLLLFVDDSFHVVGLQVARGTVSRSGQIVGVAVTPLIENNRFTHYQLRFGHAVTLEDWGTPETRIPDSRREPIETVQLLLDRLGENPGPVDGIMHAETRRAVQRFQRDHSLSVDGVISVRLVGQLFGALR
jgi:protease YdgD